MRPSLLAYRDNQRSAASPLPSLKCKAEQKPHHTFNPTILPHEDSRADKYGSLRMQNLTCFAIEAEASALTRATHAPRVPAPEKRAPYTPSAACKKPCSATNWGDPTCRVHRVLYHCSSITLLLWQVSGTMKCCHGILCCTWSYHVISIFLRA